MGTWLLADQSSVLLLLSTLPINRRMQSPFPHVRQSRFHPWKRQMNGVPMLQPGSTWDSGSGHTCPSWSQCHCHSGGWCQQSEAADLHIVDPSHFDQYPAAAFQWIDHNQLSQPPADPAGPGTSSSLPVFLSEVHGSFGH